MEIRRAREQDLLALERIECSSFNGGRFPRSVLKMLIEENEFLTLVAEEAEEVAGYGSVYMAEGGSRRIVSLAVLPEKRGQGIGTRLLRELEHLCDSSGARGICLEVAVSNLVALHLYVSEGYQIKGVITDYYGEGKDAFYMEKVL